MLQRRKGPIGRMTGPFAGTSAMANEWTNVLVLGLTWILQLPQQVCIVVVVVLILLRMGWLRAAVYGSSGLRMRWRGLSGRPRSPRNCGNRYP